MNFIKKSKYLIILVFIILTGYKSFSINHITTAESISWSGAYTSVADGFESMLYNPAGLYMTEMRYGINFFGSYGFRMWGNSISTDHVLKVFKAMDTGDNLTDLGIIDNILLFMPETGADMGVDISGGNFMTYMKLEGFSLGVSVIPKTSISFMIDKAFFTTVFQALDLTNPLDISSRLTILQYLDINIILSTRVKFLEKVIPVDKIFVGMAAHLYFPTLFMKGYSSVKLESGTPNSFGVIDNYQLRIQTDLTAGTNGLVANIMSIFPQAYEYGGNFIRYGGSAAFGLGFDFGCLIQFNRFVRLGFSFVDIGFIVFPSTLRMEMDYSIDLELESIGEFRDNFINGIQDEFEDSDNAGQGPAQWWMPNTTVRCGFAVTPFKRELLTWATDFALSDLNRLLNGGYPTFNFATGIEFKPGYNWFAVPLRLALNYNSQVNSVSLSFGIGLHLGPLEFEIGFKGLEVLISNLGAKELCAGVDMKFEF